MVQMGRMHAGRQGRCENVRTGWAIIESHLNLMMVLPLTNHNKNREAVQSTRLPLMSRHAMLLRYY